MNRGNAVTIICSFGLTLCPHPYLSLILLCACNRGMTIKLQLILCVCATHKAVANSKKWKSATHIQIRDAIKHIDFGWYIIIKLTRHNNNNSIWTLCI